MFINNSVKGCVIKMFGKIKEKTDETIFTIMFFVAPWLSLYFIVIVTPDIESGLRLVFYVLAFISLVIISIGVLICRKIDKLEGVLNETKQN